MSGKGSTAGSGSHPKYSIAIKICSWHHHLCMCHVTHLTHEDSALNVFLSETNFIGAGMEVGIEIATDEGLQRM